MNIKRIMIVVDESPSAGKAVEYGFALAKDVKGEVLLLSVIDPSLVAGNPDAGVFPDDAIIAAKSKVRKHLTNLKQRYAGEVITDLEYPVGEVQKLVIDTANHWKADLVVTGTHTGSGLSSLFSGAIEDSIIRHSPVPVFVVPGKE
jgi:nucleotide-binding universal stress UspA family protein